MPGGEIKRLLFAEGVTVDAPAPTPIGATYIDFTEQDPVPGTPPAGHVYVYAKTDGKIYKKDDTGDEKQVGSAGGGGAGANWSQPSTGNAVNAPIKSEEFGQTVYLFPPADEVNLVLFLRIPDSYTVGDIINMDIAFSSPSTSGTIRMNSIAHLIRQNQDPLSFSSNFHNSTNSAVTNTVANMYQTTTLDLSDANGELNGEPVSPGDMIKVILQRDFATDTDTEEVRFVPNGTSVRFGT